MASSKKSVGHTGRPRPAVPTQSLYRAHGLAFFFSSTSRCSFPVARFVHLRFYCFGFFARAHSPFRKLKRIIRRDRWRALLSHTYDRRSLDPDVPADSTVTSDGSGVGGGGGPYVRGDT